MDIKELKINRRKLETLHKKLEQIVLNPDLSMYMMIFRLGEYYEQLDNIIINIDTLIREHEELK